MRRSRAALPLPLTLEDQCISTFRLCSDDAYEYSVADRNDFAVMLARTSLAAHGCRAVRDRVMPVLMHETQEDEVQQDEAEAYTVIKEQFMRFFDSHGKDAAVKVLRDFGVERLNWLKPASF